MGRESCVCVWRHRQPMVRPTRPRSRWWPRPWVCRGVRSASFRGQPHVTNGCASRASMRLPSSGTGRASRPAAADPAPERLRGSGLYCPFHGRLAQLVRARGSHPRGHWFESSIAHHPSRPDPRRGVDAGWTGGARARGMHGARLHRGRRSTPMQGGAGSSTSDILRPSAVRAMVVPSLVRAFSTRGSRAVSKPTRLRATSRPPCAAAGPSRPRRRRRRRWPSACAARRRGRRAWPAGAGRRPACSRSRSGRPN